MGQWMYVEDQPAAAQRSGGCVTVGLWGLLLVVVSIMVWVIWQDMGINFAITDGPPVAVPTAAIERRVAPSPRAPGAPAPAVQAGTFEALPVPTLAPVAPVEVVPVLPQQPAVVIEAAPSGLADLPAPGPAMSLIPEAAPEGGVAPAEVMSTPDKDWMQHMLSGGTVEEWYEAHPDERP